MPTDTLGDEAQTALKSAAEALRSSRTDERRKHSLIGDLQVLAGRLSADVQERRGPYRSDLQAKEDDAIDQKWRDLNDDPRFARLNNEQKARQQTFESLRQVNEGAYPTNISPVLYVIPLIGVGIAEWYVNLSTFMAKFVPVVAIAATILVGGIFATASHFQGEFLKQISEVLHPSVEYRNELGRKIALIIATALLAAAFVVVIALRYQVIADQLGLNSQIPGTFGGSNQSIVWSNVWPTVVLNVLVWGAGVLYAFFACEKIPKLRASYRNMLRANKTLDRARQPFSAEQKRIKAHFARERDKNEVAIKEYGGLLEEVNGTITRLQGA